MPNQGAADATWVEVRRWRHCMEALTTSGRFTVSASRTPSIEQSAWPSAPTLQVAFWPNAAAINTGRLACSWRTETRVQAVGEAALAMQRLALSEISSTGP